MSLTKVLNCRRNKLVTIESKSKASLSQTDKRYKTSRKNLKRKPWSFPKQGKRIPKRTDELICPEKQRNQERISRKNDETALKIE